MTPHPHCDHECVCWWYYDHQKSGSAAPCESEKCHHRINWVDAPSEQSIRRDEREKVLDSIVIWRANKEYEMGMHYCGDDYAKAWKDEWKRIEELRQGKDGE